MKKTGLLNPALNHMIARLGHTDTFVIADCGLPIPENIPVVDLALNFGIPRFQDVVAAVFDEVEVESVVLAQETPEEVRALFSSPTTYVDHEALKRLIPEASFVIRTGEATPFANVIVRSGVPF